MATNQLKIVLTRKESHVVAVHQFFHKGGGLGQSKTSTISWRLESTKDFGDGKLGGQRPFNPRVVRMLMTKLASSLVG